MTVLWVALPMRPRVDEIHSLDRELPYVLTASFAQRHILQRGQASVDEMPVATETVLIVSARDVIQMERHAPVFASLSGQRLLQALPSLLEDEVLYFDKNHVAVSRDSADPTHLSFALMERAWLRTLLDECRGLAVRGPVRVIPAGYFQAIGSLVKIENSHTYSDIDYVCYRESVHQTQVVPLAQSSSFVNHDKASWIEGSVLDRLNELTAPFIDCRQFEFADKKMGWRALWQRWRVPSLMVISALLIHALALNGYALLLRYQNHQLSQQMRSQAQAVMAHLPSDIDPVLALRHQWAGGNQWGDHDFVVLVAKLSHLLIHQPADAVSQITYQEGKLRVLFKPGINLAEVKEQARQQQVHITELGAGSWLIQ